MPFSKYRKVLKNVLWSHKYDVYYPLQSSIHIDENINCGNSYDPAIPLLGMYLDNTLIQKDTHALMFTAALFTITKTWKCSSTDEWIKKMWYIYTMEYYSATKKNKFESVLLRWMNLAPVYIEWSKRKIYINAHIWNLEKIVLMNLFAGRNGDVHKENGHMDTVGKERVGWIWESSINIYILSCVKQIAGGKLLYNTESSAWCSVMT